MKRKQDKIKLIEELYRQHRQKHVNMMARILNGDRDTAEDVVQEAYTRAMFYSSRYDPEKGAIAPWFNRILYNSLRDVQKEFQNKPTESSDEIGVQDILNNSDTPTTIMDAIEEVKNGKHQHVLYLFYILGYTSKEIEETVEGVSQTNVTTIANRFKESFDEGN